MNSMIDNQTEAIRVENVTRTFLDGTRETQVLKGISFAVRQGEFLSITGKSGTGKSTLLYQLGLLDEPTGGSVFVSGNDAHRMSSHEKTKYRLFHFGFVFQDYAMMPELKAWENVSIPMLMRGASKAEARRRAADTLASFGMRDRIDFYPGQLSGGENQRVSIARAIVHEPRVLFADEPTANLDTERSSQIIAIFKRLNDNGQTIIMVTHELDYAHEAKRIMVMHDGVIREDKQLR